MRKPELQVFPVSGAGDVAGDRRKKATEYSVNSDGIFLTPLTEPVRFNGIFRQFDGIFLTASVDTVSVPGTWPRVGGA